MLHLFPSMKLPKMLYILLPAIIGILIIDNLANASLAKPSWFRHCPSSKKFLLLLFSYFNIQSNRFNQVLFRQLNDDPLSINLFGINRQQRIGFQIY
jgi:hypothetical protein